MTQPEHLPAIDDTEEAAADHPDEVSEEEAARGHAMYLRVDDLDDDSDGIEP